MAEEKRCASSPCSADEMDDAYAGYLPPEELAAALERLIALAAVLGPDTTERWRKALRPMPAERPETRQRCADREALRAEGRALLPKIRDDRLHAALKTLLSEL